MKFYKFARFGNYKTVVGGFIALVVLLMSAVTVKAEQALRIATTTSTHNSGLTDSLFPRFEKKYNYKIVSSAIGTGKALQMGRDGLVDVLIVHARQAEDAFMAAGFGMNRRDLMYNDFVIVGPEKDPAGITKATKAMMVTEVFRRLSNSGSVFISRADDSGTNKKEMLIWKKAGIEPYGEWYYESGRSMVDVLKVASAKGYYTLTDRGTWLANRKHLALRIMFEGDPLLNNPYGVITVRPREGQKIDVAGANLFMNWITSENIKSRISDFKIDGQQLFFPM